MKDAVSGKAGDILRSPVTAKRVSDAEDWWISKRYSARLEDGTLRGVQIVVHRGFVADGEVRVHLRVVEAPQLPKEVDEQSSNYLRILNTNLRRQVMLPFPGVPVRAQIGDAVGEAVTDRHGYASMKFQVEGLDAGWHEVTVQTLPEEEDLAQFSDSGRVLQPDLDAPFLVVSDIDDTVLRTGITEGFSAVRRSLLGNAHSRKAVSGMASLYRGLERGVVAEDGTQPARSPFFYLSTGPWFAYEPLVQFLQLRGYPRGPLLLTDWGPTDKYLRRSGVEHKKKALRRLQSAYPELPKVLIGDAGQNDPDIYVDFARENPDVIKWILIVKPGSGADEQMTALRNRVPELRDEGIPILVVDDALAAAQDAVDLGLCDEVTIEEVETELGAVF